ncbi:MAG: hypothetical protein GY822_10305 [Deltaproteobacteria bacterium]|nr:hypothetical protein [Deltaproteobacteria bacterium]
MPKQNFIPKVQLRLQQGLRLRWVLMPVAVVLVVGGLSACPEDPRIKNRRDSVVTFAATQKANVDSIKTGNEPARISQRAFLQALTWAGAGRIEPQSRDALARHVLSRLIDETLIEKYAQQYEISVSDKDVHREVRRVRTRYESGEFERFVHNEQMTLVDHEERVRKRLLSAQVLKSVLKRSQKVNQSAIDAAYKEQIVEKPKEEQVHVRQILVATEEEAAHVLSELRRKRITFSQAARRYSDGPEGSKGGELGWFTKNEMPAFFQECFSLPLNKISDVLPSEFGFHIFEALGKRKAGYVPSVLEAKKHLVAELRREQEGKSVKKFLLSLRRKVDIDINENALQKVLLRLPVFEPLVHDAGTQKTPAHSHSTPPPSPPGLSP